MRCETLDLNVVDTPTCTAVRAPTTPRKQWALALSTPAAAVAPLRALLRLVPRQPDDTEDEPHRGEAHDEDLVVRDDLVEEPLSDRLAELLRVDLERLQAVGERLQQLHLQADPREALPVGIGRCERHPFVDLVLANVQAEPLRFTQQDLA